GVLQHGTSRSSVAMAIVTSAEADARDVASLYQHYLHRQPAPSETGWWVSFMQQGTREVRLIAQFTTSDEYYQSQQNRPEALVMPGDMQYVGAFRVPAIPDPASGDSTYSFGGTALTFNPV